MRAFATILLILLGAAGAAAFVVAVADPFEMPTHKQNDLATLGLIVLVSGWAMATMTWFRLWWMLHPKRSVPAIAVGVGSAVILDVMTRASGEAVVTFAVCAASIAWWGIWKWGA